jgi:hypothetical protein
MMTAADLLWKSKQVWVRLTASSTPKDESFTMAKKTASRQGAKRQAKGTNTGCQRRPPLPHTAAVQLARCSPCLPVTVDDAAARQAERSIMWF